MAEVGATTELEHLEDFSLCLLHKFLEWPNSPSNVIQDVLDATSKLLKFRLKSNQESAGKSYTRNIVNVATQLSLQRRLFPPTFSVDETEYTDKEEHHSGAFIDLYRSSSGTRKVAVKRVRYASTWTAAGKERVKQAFYRVALQQTFLEHPNISEFFGVSSLGIDAPTLAMISPWASNGNICDAIDAKRSSGELVTAHSLNGWLHDVALGMEHLHSLGIVHGALHGTNILISEEGRAQLTDIGMATIAQAVAHNLNLPGCGGNRWTAPELIDPEEFGLTSSEPTIFGDVYSFGFLCVELYSGGPAFYGLDEYQVGKRVVRGERPPRPTDPRMSDSLWSLVTICWGQNAHHRPEIATVVRTVAIILDEVVGYATPETRDSSLSEVSASFVTMSSDIAQEVGILVKNNANVVDDNFELIERQHLAGPVSVFTGIRSSAHHREPLHPESPYTPPPRLFSSPPVPSSSNVSAINAPHSYDIATPLTSTGRSVTVTVESPLTPKPAPEEVQMNGESVAVDDEITPVESVAVNRFPKGKKGKKGKKK